ncbi:unnamed protein product [Adineta steineri]|uniref:Uncharacterized protein n=1 Tax=Adineta steineri TaxID=433720 RepID=A0A818G1H9_9BILA|nr:unnamed protein product [Adineta steineri]CAF3483021.1 unnamed protein product [Adineta steineri]
MSALLFNACQKGNSDYVKSLIDSKYDINQLDEQGRSALHYCSENTDINCACLLLKDDAIKTNILNLRDNEGCSALHLACMNGNETMVKFLCEQGANVELVDNESHSLIHWITVCGHLHLFDILLQYKAPIHTADIHNAFPIHYASQLCSVSTNEDLRIDSARGLAILQKFIDHKVNIDCTDGQTRTPLMWAASAGYIIIKFSFLVEKIDISSAIDAIRLLYKYGANQLHIDKDSLSGINQQIVHIFVLCVHLNLALHCAATRGHASCIRMLVEQCGCPIEGEDLNGCTALFYAITLDHPDVCQVLLKLKADPNHKDNRGRTPSHCAISKGNLICLKYLIEFHANIWLKNKRGDYPIHEAINSLSVNKVRNQTDESLQVYNIIRYIFKLYPYRISIQNDEHRTPLHLAASLGDIDTCEVLIECGVKINSFMRTSAGNYLTPYDLARIRCQEACMKYLIHKHGGQRGNLLANIYARRIQKYFRQYKVRKNSLVIHREKSTPKIINNSSKQSTNILTKPKNVLLKQAQLCLDNKKYDDLKKTRSLNFQPLTKNSLVLDEINAQERRRVFAKSKTTITPLTHSDEAKLDPTNKIIIHTSNSISTSNKLYERRKLLAEELHKLKQARLHHHYIVINRPLYKILIENAFNPQNRRADEIEKYLETLLKAYDTELEAIRKRTRSVPPKLNRRTSQLL